MSRSSWLEITYSSTNTTPYQLLTILLDAGWNLNDFGDITFIPLGEVECFEWERLPYNAANMGVVLALLQAKEQAQEPLGVALQWQDTHCGGLGFFRHDGTIAFSASINRRTIPDLMDVTDVHWYLYNLLKPLMDYGITIEYIEWTDHV